MDIPLPHCYAFARPAVSVDMVVLRRDGTSVQILLIRRKKDPHKGAWAIPGGFIEMDETTAQAAARELQEETGLTGIELARIDVFDAVDRDPRGRTISVAYMGFVTAQQTSTVKAGDDAGDAKWFPLSNIPELGFDHAAIIAAAREKLNV